MAFNEFRNTQSSFQVDESDEDLNQSNRSTATTTVSTPTTMSTTTPTTATGTRPTTTATATTTTGPQTNVTQAPVTVHQQYPRGHNHDSIYRPNGSNVGTPRNPAPQTPRPSTSGTQQQPATQQQQPPTIDYRAMSRDPDFIAAMTNIMRGIFPQTQQSRSGSPLSNPDSQDHIRTSTPNEDDRNNRTHRSDIREPRTNLTQQMNNLRTVDTPRTPSAIIPHPERLATTPTYIPAAEQALQIHKNAADAARTNADLFSGFAEFMNIMAESHPNPPAGIPQMVHTFTQKAILAQRDANAKTEGLQHAQRVTRYYETPIAKPAFPVPDHRRFIRVNHKELLMLTGYFDPNDKSHDFKHTWQKLLDYGSMNEFQEEHYMQALGSILKGEAYENFTEFKSMNKSLEDILDYFAGVYTKKRCLASDRKAVDEFTRKKGESIIVCMERAILAIDKLRYVYPTSGWQALRQQMRQNILMQVVKEETKRALQMEVDNVHEDTGMPYDFEKLIRFADRYERNHNAAPKDDLTTLFKVASGGLQRQTRRSNSQDQLQHVKKDQMLQKQIATLQAELKELKTNEARFYKNEGRTDRNRESRRTERDSRRREGRSQSYDRNRNMDKTTTSAATTAPAKTTTSRPSSAPNEPTQSSYKPPNPYASREQSRSPMRRDQTPSQPNNYNLRNRSSSNYSRNNSRGRERERSRSNNRYDRNRSSGSRMQSRSNSTGGTDHITSTGSKTVIITINGQDYVPLKKEN